MYERYFYLRQKYETFCLVPLFLLKLEYSSEILNFSNETYEPGARAARLSAAIKRYKTSQMILFVLNMSEKENLDITPVLAKKFCFEFFKRKGSQAIMVKLFGEAGRINRSDSNDRKLIESIVKKHRKEADKFWLSTLDDIALVKMGYQKDIKERNEKQAYDKANVR